MAHKNTSGLSKESRKKKQEALERTEKAIDNLTKNKKKITVRAVAREARVSTSYIYKYPELAYKIQKLREEQKYSLVLSDRHDTKTKKEREILDKEIKELKQENAELKHIIEQTKVGKKSVKELKTENIRLIQENIKLKKELDYTLENLQSARQFIIEQSHGNTEQQNQNLKAKEIQKVSAKQQKK